MLALRDMPHLAFNQKQTANKQPPTGTGAERTRPAHSTPHMGLGQRPLALCFPPANRGGRGHGLHSETVYFSLLCFAFAHFWKAEAKPQTKPNLKPKQPL